MNVGDVLKYINEIAPMKYAENWDNVGLMVGSRSTEITKILTCLDITSKVIDEAISGKANLIVSHHPFMFSKLSNIDLDTLKGEQIATLLKNDISVISAHTNLDVAAGGVNDTLAESIGLSGCIKVKSYVPEGSECDLGLGKVGELQNELFFNDFVSSVKKNLSIDNVRIIGAMPKTVRKVAVMCGSFDKDDLESVKCHNADVLVTGDIKYHTAVDAREIGMCIVDAGHFATEHKIAQKLKSLLEDRFDNIDVICSTMEEDPFIFA
jgi:dinuclear metal center YbgI/SA1388 family protein